MEEKIEAVEAVLQEQEGKTFRVSNGSSSSTGRSTTRSKKESLRLKKALKKEISTLENASLSNYENQISQNSIEDNSSCIPIKAKTKNDKVQQKSRQPRLPFSLEKILIKPPYITISGGCKVVGNFGHATALFKRPIIQGHYFLEFIVREDAEKEKPTNFGSGIRIGICNLNFSPSFPLGYGQSIAYKSVDGAIIKDGERIEECKSYRVGDKICISLVMSPLSKYPAPEKINEGSSVSFYKNGVLMAVCQSLKQVFYCFGVSLYNYSQIEVLGGTGIPQYLKGEHKNYFESLTQPIPYHDLEQKNIFKI